MGSSDTSQGANPLSTRSDSGFSFSISIMSASSAFLAGSNPFVAEEKPTEFPTPPFPTPPLTPTQGTPTVTVTTTTTATATTTVTATATTTATATATATPKVTPTKAPTKAPTPGEPEPTKPAAVVPTVPVQITPDTNNTEPTVTTGGTNTSTEATPTVTTSTNQGNKGSLIPLILIIGGISVTVITVASILIVLEIRKKEQLALLSTQTGPGQDPWGGPGEAYMFSNQAPMLDPGPPMMDTAMMSPAMKDILQQAPQMYMADADPVMQQQQSPQVYMAGPDPTMLQRQPSQLSMVGPEQHMAQQSLHSTMPMQDALLPLSQLERDTPAPDGLSATSDMNLTMNFPEEVAPKLGQSGAPGTIPFTPSLPGSDDPFLEAMMRQAQMGIFVLPNKEPVTKD
jgi:hypothetical protein